MPAKKSVKKKVGKPTQKRLRDIAWEIGQKYHTPPETDHIALLMINPHAGHVYWHIMENSLNELRVQLGRKSDYASLVVRIYDITDIIFDGFNAHTFFDIEVGERSGNYYFKIDRTARNYLAEAGLRCRDGSQQGTALPKPACGAETDPFTILRGPIQHSLNGTVLPGNIAQKVFLREDL
jgi:hypothetical protein